MSGIEVNEEVVTTFAKLKNTSGAGRIKMIEMRISDSGKEVIVESSELRADGHTPEKEKECWEAFLAKLPPKEPRWFVYDYSYKKDDGLREKILFVHW